MTNKEAIKILVGNRNFYERIVRPYDREMVEALNMAIKALEEQERQTGEWEDYSVSFYKCPECGYLLEKDCPRCQNKIILPRGGRE